MPLFEIKNKKAKQVNTKEFKNELELRSEKLLRKIEELKKKVERDKSS